VVDSHITSNIAITDKKKKLIKTESLSLLLKRDILGNENTIKNFNYGQR